MDGTHFHLVFTHAVVWFSLAGVLVLAWSLLRKSSDARTIGLGMILGASLLAIPVYLTGEEAEHTVEEYGVSHDIIHEHEEAAELTFIGLEVLGMAALMALLLGMRGKETSITPTVVVLILGLVVVVMTLRVAGLGGEIRHEEIRDGAVAGEHHDAGDDDHDEDDGDDPEPTPDSWE